MMHYFSEVISKQGKSIKLDVRVWGQYDGMFRYVRNATIDLEHHSDCECVFAGMIDENRTIYNVQQFLVIDGELHVVDVEQIQVSRLTLAVAAHFARKELMTEEAVVNVN